MTKDPDWVSPGEAAKILNVSRSTFYRLLERRALAHCLGERVQVAHDEACVSTRRRSADHNSTAPIWKRGKPQENTTPGS